MYPKHHLIVGLIAAAILFPLFKLNVALIVAASVLVDVDHVFIYVYRYKNLDLKKAYDFFKRAKDGSSFYPVFHMAEFIVPVAFASYFYPILFPIAIGLVIHIAVDWFEDNFLRQTNRNFFITKIFVK